MTEQQVDDLQFLEMAIEQVKAGAFLKTLHVEQRSGQIWKFFRNRNEQKTARAANKKIGKEYANAGNNPPA